MSQAKKGDRVKVNYSLAVDNNTVIENTKDMKPIEFKLSAGEALPSFEQAVIGMSPGETKSIEIPSKEAYGERREELIMKVDRKDLPEDLNPQVGQQLRLDSEKHEPFMVTVTGVSESELIMDANHPLAGKNLSFEIELIEIL
jgi:FKBP-type peptidyl-prolyl cis-trans isomerase 2